jgi:predicted transcriptional regulator
MTNIRDDDIGIDSVLLTVENPVRRKIIRQLSQEPSYQLRISKQLGFSQQLVAKHLDAMEDSGVVSSQMEASPHGPKRREYLLNRSVSLTIDFAPNLFRARVVEFDPLPEVEASSSSREVFRMLAEVMQRPDENRKLRPLATLIKEIDRKLTSLEDERSVLLYLRNLAMKEVSKSVGGRSGAVAAGGGGRGGGAGSGGQDNRDVLNQLVDENEKSLRETFRGLNMADEWVRAIIAELESGL